MLDSSVKHQDKELSRVRLVRVLCDRTLSAGQRHKYPFLTQEGTEFYVRGRVGSAGSQAVLILTTHPNYHAEPLSSPDPAVPAMSFNMVGFVRAGGACPLTAARSGRRVGPTRWAISRWR